MFYSSRVLLLPLSPRTRRLDLESEWRSKSGSLCVPSLPKVRCTMGSEVSARDAYYPLGITFVVLNTVACGLRLWARVLKRALGYDDLALGISFVSRGDYYATLRRP